MSLKEKIVEIHERETEFLGWALNGEEVHFSVLTTNDIQLAHRMAREGMIRFNEIGTTGDVRFGETPRTRELWRMRIDQKAMTERKAQYLEGALF